MAVSSNGTTLIFNDGSTQRFGFTGAVAAANITGTITGPQIAPGVIPSGGFTNLSVFTSPGTFNIPPSTTKLKVTVVGGGAGVPGTPSAQSRAGGAGATGGPSSFGSYQTATGGSVPASGTAPGADLILDGQLFGKYGSSIVSVTAVSTPIGFVDIAGASPFAGRGGYGEKIISAPFPVTAVPITVGPGGGGGGGGGSDGTGAGGAGQAGSGANGGNGGAGGNSPPSLSKGAGGGGGGGAAGIVGTAGAAGTMGTGVGGGPAQAGTPGTGPFNRFGGGAGGAGGVGGGEGSNAGNGGAGAHSGIVIVEY